MRNRAHGFAPAPAPAPDTETAAFDPHDYQEHYREDYEHAPDYCDCGGIYCLLGQLGRLYHYQCRNCGQAAAFLREGTR